MRARQCFVVSSRSRVPGPRAVARASALTHLRAALVFLKRCRRSECETCERRQESLQESLLSRSSDNPTRLVAVFLHFLGLHRRTKSTFKLTRTHSTGVYSALTRGSTRVGHAGFAGSRCTYCARARKDKKAAAKDGSHIEPTLGLSARATK